VVPNPDGKPQAPHIVLAVSSRGMRLHHTRIYFDGEAGNATDPALASADRPATLIGKLKAGGANVTYSLDIDPQATPRRYSSTFGDGIGIFRLSYLHLAGAGSNWTMMDWNERSYFSIS
jgi:protocatechuate 3,4-dioxygenase beta subunit